MPCSVSLIVCITRNAQIYFPSWVVVRARKQSYYQAYKIDLILPSQVYNWHQESKHTASSAPIPVSKARKTAQIGKYVIFYLNGPELGEKQQGSNT